MSKPDQQAISIVESLCSANSHSKLFAHSGLAELEKPRAQ